MTTECIYCGDPSPDVVGGHVCSEYQLEQAGAKREAFIKACDELGEMSGSPHFQDAMYQVRDTILALFELEPVDQ